MDPEEVTDPTNALQAPTESVPLPTKKEVIPEETMQSMQKLWRVFDMKKTGSVSIAQLKGILGALDFHMNNKELAIVTK